MRAEEFLSQAFRLDQQIQSKVAQLSRLRACTCGSGLRYGDVKVQSSGPDSRVEDAVLKIMEEERAINEEIDQLVEIKRQIREVINQVEDVTCRLLLEKRNLLFESWPKISSDLGIGLRWCQIRHKDAVGMVQEVLDRMGWEEWNDRDGPFRSTLSVNPVGMEE